MFMSVLGPDLEFGWAFACVLLECALSTAHFSVFSPVALQNIYVSKLVENVSKKGLILGFGLHICFVLLNVGGRIVS